MSETELLIVHNGLIENRAASDEAVFVPHPALAPWRPHLERMRGTWFHSTPMMPVEWYSTLTGNSLTDLISVLFDVSQTGRFSQLWIASPFHARLTRDRLQVMPDSIFPWSASDGLWLTDLLNPLLQEEGMQLVSSDSLLFLLCEQPLDATPLSFAAVSGHTLPNRHPDGADGGRMMRLKAEIQMMLNQHPCEARRQRGEPDVDGLWLWGGSPVNREEQRTVSLSVATRNPLLSAVADGVDARITITEADRLEELVKMESKPPVQMVLAGGGYAVFLKRGLLPKFGRSEWLPVRVKDESALLGRLKGVASAG